MSANSRQVGGDHYKCGDHEEHWDRAWRLKFDPFQYIITKWVERHRDKGGLEDLRKAQHALEKYIEVLQKEAATQEALETIRQFDAEDAEMQIQMQGYVNQG